MNGRELAVFLMVCVPAAVFLVPWLLRHLGRRHDLRLKKLQVLQQALEHPALDEATRAALTRQLVDDHRRSRRPWLERWGMALRVGHVLLLAAGWLMMVGGGAAWVIGELQRWSRYSLEPAIVATVAGFALVTLPVALREMLRRERSAGAPAGR